MRQRLRQGFGIVRGLAGWGIVGVLVIHASGIRARAEPAPPRPTAPAVIIIDGSGSMWGGLGPERAAKFDLVRAALRQALDKLGPQSRLGLMSFGQRRRADCSDVEVVAPIEAGPGERILALADRLNPKGKGPLALALKEAAKQFPPGTDGSIILVHDGVDNCMQDPCAAAADIAKTNPGLAVHVIGLGLEKADLQRMSCVPRSTKGQLFDARDTATLTAAVTEAVRLANPDPGNDMANLEPSLAAPAPQEASGLRLTASLAANGAALDLPITWRIAKAGAGDPLLSRRSSAISVNVPAGSYDVDASYGLAKVHQTIEVAAKEPTSARLALGAGILKLSASANKNGSALAEPVVTLSAAPAGMQKRGNPLWIGRDANAEIVVPAGSYRIRVEDGLASKEADVEVTPGNRTEAPFVLGTGTLELSAAGPAEAAALLGDVVYTVSEDDPDAPQGRRDVARSADPNPSFVLPAGTYYVTAAAGAAEVRERVAVGSGDAVKHLVTFNAVKLAVAVLLDGATPNATQPVTVRVMSTEATSVEIARSMAAAPEFLLPPRRYRVDAQLGGDNVKATADADLQSGRETKVSFRLQSAGLTVTARSRAGAFSAPWQVKDEQGNTVLHSGPGGARSARLAPGRYVLQSHLDNQLVEQSLELKPGEQKAVEVATD